LGTPDGTAPDVHVPANAASAADVAVGDGVAGLAVCGPPLHAETETASAITPNMDTIRIGSIQYTPRLQRSWRSPRTWPAIRAITSLPEAIAILITIIFNWTAALTKQRATIARALQKLLRRDHQSSETLRNHRNEPRHASCFAATPMDSARSAKRAAMILVGESLREMAVLIAVFAPLDMLVQDRSLTARSVTVMLSIVVPLFSLGLFLEVRQPWRD
jgi:hypothetical protein